MRKKSQMTTRSKRKRERTKRKRKTLAKTTKRRRVTKALAKNSKVYTLGLMEIQSLKPSSLS